jgi:hypothetical protein
MNMPDKSQPQWNGIIKTGAVAAFAMLAVMIAQILVFVVWPPPETVEAFFALFQQSRLLGLLSLDLLYLVNNTLLILFYLGVFAALRKVSFSASLIALLLGLVGISAYYGSNTAFEMLSLSSQFAAATTDAARLQLLAAGQVMLETYKGTSFDVYYVLNGIMLLILAVVMLRTPVFNKVTAFFALASGILMSIPSSAGAIGMVFALASLIPWAVFSVLAALRLLQLSGTARDQ